MKIEYITNASFLFTFSDGTTVLTDPWYEDGIYHGLLSITLLCMKSSAHAI